MDTRDPHPMVEMEMAATQMEVILMEAAANDLRNQVQVMVLHLLTAMVIQVDGKTFQNFDLNFRS